MVQLLKVDASNKEQAIAPYLRKQEAKAKRKAKGSTKPWGRTPKPKVSR